MHTPAEYFEGFLTRHMNRELLPGYDGFSSDFAVRFRDLGETWFVRIQAGRVTGIGSVAPPDGAAVSFGVDLPVFAEIVAGRLSPQQAFFRRQTEIGGDLFAAMKLARILGDFFSSHPYDA